MKKLCLFILILSLATLLLATETVAILSVSKGKVSLERNKQDLIFKKGELLKNDDILRTKAESFAAYKFIDASSLVKLFSNSVVSISATQLGAKLSKKVNIERGSILSSVKSGSGAFAIHTPTTVASVKGTEFMTRVDENGNSMFIVTDGEVELQIKVTGETVTVVKGKTANVDRRGGLTVADSSPEDISSIELSELEANQEIEPTTIRIPVIDEAGNTKYIEITY
ncbi:MAG: FecR family protein [Candidatus Cloacimonadaceae bacterium]|jgi:hypothetical protein|nr:FecR family protein [Candidatus Cloacimonadota bacterium]MDY0126877.1 FecR family protein [Candidatus Cloacimonadaceae bacterium]MCB5254675.1 FecR family protein [Candidatus Cloacimonadota bacterium]MCK9178641.1 FecR family protein [Candidatus Cloacimonadota bacterium]MCK9241789.1 FecR family protein [Candidatus Cloacimonadota bacterium]